jgi:hypothetical protein
MEERKTFKQYFWLSNALRTMFRYLPDDEISFEYSLVQWLLECQEDYWERWVPFSIESIKEIFSTDDSEKIRMGRQAYNWLMEKKMIQTQHDKIWGLEEDDIDSLHVELRINYSLDEWMANKEERDVLNWIKKNPNEIGLGKYFEDIRKKK